MWLISSHTHNGFCFARCYKFECIRCSAGHARGLEAVTLSLLRKCFPALKRLHDVMSSRRSCVMQAGRRQCTQHKLSSPALSTSNPIFHCHTKSTTPCRLLPSQSTSCCTISTINHTTNLAVGGDPPAMNAMIMEGAGRFITWVTPVNSPRCPPLQSPKQRLQCTSNSKQKVLRRPNQKPLDRHRQSAAQLLYRHLLMLLLSPVLDSCETLVIALQGHAVTHLAPSVW